MPDNATLTLQAQVEKHFLDALAQRPGFSAHARDSIAALLATGRATRLGIKRSVSDALDLAAKAAETTTPDAQE